MARQSRPWLKIVVSSKFFPYFKLFRPIPDLWTLRILKTKRKRQDQTQTTHVVDHRRPGPFIGLSSGAWTARHWQIGNLRPGDGGCVRRRGGVGMTGCPDCYLFRFYDLWLLRLWGTECAPYPWGLRKFIAGTKWVRRGCGWDGVRRYSVWKRPGMDGRGTQCGCVQDGVGTC